MKKSILTLLLFCSFFSFCQITNNEQQEIPFALVEKAPIYPGCSESPNNEITKKCFSKNVNTFVKDNFDYTIATKLGLVGKQRLTVIFQINTEGEASKIRARATHTELEKHIIDIVKALPKMVPGSQKGEAVIVPYSLPFVFIVEQKKVTINKTNIDGPVSFSIVENPPIYPGCEKASNSIGKKTCMSKKITEHINKRFNTQLATDLNLQGKQRINVVFKIGKLGKAINIKAHGPHLELEKEAIRVINTLPNMKPGTQEGKLVTVSYSLPIIFNVRADTKSKNSFNDPFYKNN